MSDSGLKADVPSSLTPKRILIRFQLTRCCIGVRDVESGGDAAGVLSHLNKRPKTQGTRRERARERDVIEGTFFSPANVQRGAIPSRPVRLAWT